MEKIQGFQMRILNSATAGLNLAFDILKEEYDWKEDESYYSPLTFVSSNHAIVLSGLKAVLLMLMIPYA